MGVRLTFLTRASFYPQHHKNKDKDVPSQHESIVFSFSLILVYSSYIQSDREYAGTQPQPMSEHNCWDHAPSSALLGNVLLLPRALHHGHCLRHQHCVQELSSLIAFQRQGATMYANLC